MTEEDLIIYDGAEKKLRTKKADVPEIIEGPQGPKGDKGDKGDQGEPGPRGKIGLTGAKGNDGDLGNPGDKGDKGDKGDGGNIGNPGVDGKNGKDGEDGVDGLSPMEGVDYVIVHGRDGADGTSGIDGSPDTAEEVLTKLLTVDGIDSLLDADLLDGEHGNYYQIAGSYLLDTGDTATGSYTFDTNTLFIDSVNHRVGIGTTSPNGILSIPTGQVLIGTNDKFGSSKNSAAELQVYGAIDIGGYPGKTAIIKFWTYPYLNSNYDGYIKMAEYKLSFGNTSALGNSYLIGTQLDLPTSIKTSAHQVGLNAQMTTSESGTAGYTGFNINVDENSLGSGTHYLLTLQTNKTNRMYIDNSGGGYFAGNVGIGTTMPQNKLDVEGGAVIGSTYSGTNTAPTDGLLVEGNIGIGTTTPSAKLHLPAGTAAANTAPLKIDAGTVATTPVSGNIESDGVHLWWTDSAGTRRQLDN